MVYKASTESEAKREKIGQARKEFLNIKHGRRPSGEEQVKYQVIVKGLERDTFWTFTRSYFLPYFKNLVLNCRQSLSDHDSIIFVLFRGVFT